MNERPTEFDRVLDLCQHQHRRIVMRVLEEEQRVLTLEELTKAVFKYNHQTPLTEVSEDPLRRVRSSLFHIHLPKLAQGEFINYDPEHQLVEPTEQLDPVESTLSTVLAADPTLEAPMEL